MFQTSAFQIAQRFVGIREIPGIAANPIILAMLQLDAKWVQDDATPWCSAFVNYIAWICRLPRSKSLAARSWLQIGAEIPIELATADSDIVVLKRGKGKQPGPEVIAAPGHVGFYGGYTPDNSQVLLLGGNQGDSVTIAPFAVENILGIRRL